MELGKVRRLECATSTPAVDAILRASPRIRPGLGVAHIPCRLLLLLVNAVSCAFERMRAPSWGFQQTPAHKSQLTRWNWAMPGPGWLRNVALSNAGPVFGTISECLVER